MSALAKALRITAFAAVVAGLAAAPALARLDVYRCTMMRSTHVGRCCALRREHAKTASVRAERRACCELESKGSEAPPAHATLSTPVVAPAAGSLVAELAPAPSRRATPRPVDIRSRAPPDDPLWLRHASFLL